MRKIGVDRNTHDIISKRRDGRDASFIRMRELGFLGND